MQEHECYAIPSGVRGRRIGKNTQRNLGLLEFAAEIYETQDDVGIFFVWAPAGSKLLEGRLRMQDIRTGKRVCGHGRSVCERAGVLGSLELEEDEGIERSSSVYEHDHEASTYVNNRAARPFENLRGITKLIGRARRIRRTHEDARHGLLMSSSMCR